MKLQYKIALILLPLGALVLAGTEVDQGKPGHYGPWPVSISGGALTLSSAVVVDGGYLNSVGTVTNGVIVAGKLIIDGGSITPTPPAASSSSTSTLATVLASNGTPCTVGGGASCTNIYGGSGGTSWLGYQNMTVTIYNSGANIVDNVLIEWSPNGTNWEVWDSTTFANLVVGSIPKSLALTGNSRHFLRIEARSASGATANVYVDGTSQAY